MFEGMNAIAWYDLKHAYGSAEEVPMWLRQLASPLPEVRHQAIYHLMGSICHQGWICPATGYAVPYLIELLAQPAIEDKAALLDLLTCIAEADPLYEETWRHNPGVPSWEVPPHISFKDAHAELRAGTPLFVSLLDDPQPDLRMGAAHLLAQWPDQEQEMKTLLLEKLARERDQRVRSNLLLALGILLQRQVTASADDWEVFTPFLTGGESELPTFCAALALTRLAQDQAPQDAIRLLAQVMTNPTAFEDYLTLPCSEGAAWSAAYHALFALPAQRIQFVLPPLQDMIQQAERFRASMLAHMLLYLVFEQQPETATAVPPLPAAELTGQQREALALLCDHSEIWRIGNFADLLRSYGLPGRRQEMASYLGIKLPEAPPASKTTAGETRLLRGEGVADGVISLLRVQHPELRVRQVQTVIQKASGVADDELTVNDEMIFRFPRQARAVERMEREISLLRLLQGRVPLAVPRPLYTSASREVGRAYAGYSKLPGKPLLKELLESVEGEETVQRLATQLASFLHALHHLSVPDFVDLELPLAHTRPWCEESFAVLRAELLPHLPQEQRQSIEGDMATLLDQVGGFAIAPRLIHGTFDPHAILYDAGKYAISGIIDFRQSALGDPAWDFAALVRPDNYGREFLLRGMSAYPELETLLERAWLYSRVHLWQEAWRLLTRQSRAGLQQVLRVYPSEGESVER